MATTTSRQLMTDGLSGSSITMLSKITANTVWAETSLQYLFGGSSALGLDSEFANAFGSAFGGSSETDAVFAFSALAERDLAMIDAVTALDFTAATGTSDADLVMASTDDRPNSSLEGFFYFPGDMTKSGGDSWSFGAFNSGLSYMKTPAEIGGGQYANWTIIHEIGHGLGLKHTHQEVNGTPPLAVIGKYMDNEKYSVMSYDGATQANAYGHAVSMMGLDVASLQALYGADDYAADSSTYSLMNAKGGALDLAEGAVAIGRAYYCIWDSDGADKIDYAGGGHSVLINLNDATLDTSSISADLKALFSELKHTTFYNQLSNGLQQEIVDRWHHAGGFFSRVLDNSGSGYKAVDGGYSIAHGAVIENAIGGNRADLLIGNEAGNILTGASGSDTMLGGDGADTLLGGAGKDRLDGGRGVDVLIGGGGDDRFVFADGYGQDTITDFSNGDLIDLTRLWGFSSYHDLKSHHMTNVDGDAVITVGSDVLVVEGVLTTDLGSGDFRI